MEVDEVDSTMRCTGTIWSTRYVRYIDRPSSGVRGPECRKRHAYPFGAVQMYNRDLNPETAAAGVRM